MAEEVTLDDCLSKEKPIPSVEETLSAFRGLTIRSLWENHRKKLLHGIPSEHRIRGLVEKCMPELYEKFMHNVAGSAESRIVSVRISLPFKVASYNDPSLLTMKEIEDIVKDAGKRFVFQTLLTKAFEDHLQPVFMSYGVPDDHEVFAEVDIQGISEDMTVAQVEIGIPNLWF